MARLNLLDIAKLNGTDKTVGLIEENLAFAPEMSVFPMRTIRGTSFYTVKRTGFPAVSFRHANGGVVPTKSTFQKQLTELFILSGTAQVDTAVADANDEGAAHLQMIEASGFYQSALRKIGSQIWYGTDDQGFSGIKELLPKGGTQVVNATGTTANTASSVYAVKFGAQDVSLVVKEGAVFELGEFRREQVVDPADQNGRMPAYVANLDAWIGLAVLNVNCCARILNLTEEAGKGLTDGLLSALFATFPVGYKPDALFMTKRSQCQLQRTRTVTLVCGPGGKLPNQSNIAPLPTEYDGVPIIATDSILNTDAIE